MRMEPEVHRIRLKTLSPVHVGSEDSVTPSGYLSDGQRIYIIDPDRLFRALSPEQQNYYLRWFDESLAVKQTLQLTDFFIKYLPSRLRPVPGLTAGFMQSLSSYSMALKGPHPAGRGVVRQHIQTPWHQPYIPGSTLKGAMRTAILNSRLRTIQQGELKARARLRLRLESVDVGNIYDSDEVKDELRATLSAVASATEADLLRGDPDGVLKRQDAAQYDLLRFLQVSDSTPFPTSAMSVQVTASTGTYRNTRAWIEAIEIGEVSTFTITAYPQAPLNDLGIPTQLHRILNLDTLFDILHRRAERRLQREAQYPNYNEAVRKLIGYLQGQNSKEAPVLRLGAGQTFRGTTITEVVEIPPKNPFDDEEDSVHPETDLYVTKVAEAMKVITRGDSGDGIIPASFPKTRRTVLDERYQPVDLLGWVQLSRI